MQGGHPDGLRLRFGRVTRAGSADSTSSGYESELSVNDVVSLGRRLDRVVQVARESFGTALALPVAWIQLQPNVEALRLHKMKRVESGIDSILWIQTFRTRELDVLMQLFSLCAEEEFYLLMLPLLFWNGYYDLGRRLTFVVNAGLFAGNIIKDIFELPRPSSPPVWRAANQEELDSSALKDFGFPSTHAMNAVSNSVLVAWYFWDRSSAMTSSYNLGLIGLVIIWISSLSFSRLYLGAHTGTDVRGGLGLGVLVIGLYLRFYSVLDAALSSASPENLFVFLFVSSIIALLLCPQPRPPTPTFNQNAFICGLLWGLLYGSRVADDLNLTSSEGFGVKATNRTMAIGVGIVRSVLGFVLTIVIRQIVKTLTMKILEGLFGIKTKPQEEVVRKRNKVKKGEKKVITRLFTRDVDIIAVAIVKAMTYLATAATITLIYPYLFDLGSRRLVSSSL